MAFYNVVSVSPKKDLSSLIIELFLSTFGQPLKRPNQPFIGIESSSQP